MSHLLKWCILFNYTYAVQCDVLFDNITESRLLGLVESAKEHAWVPNNELSCVTNVNHSLKKMWTRCLNVLQDLYLYAPKNGHYCRGCVTGGRNTYLTRLCCCRGWVVFMYFIPNKEGVVWMKWFFWFENFFFLHVLPCYTFPSVFTWGTCSCWWAVLSILALFK